MDVSEILKTNQRQRSATCGASLFPYDAIDEIAACEYK